jgi:hypothetical protein
LPAQRLYQVTESSNIGERKQFYAMLDFVRETHKTIKSRVVLAVDKVDRLMRNFKDYPAVQELVEKKIAEIHIFQRKQFNAKDVLQLPYNDGVKLYRCYKG